MSKRGTFSLGPFSSTSDVGGVNEKSYLGRIGGRLSSRCSQAIGSPLTRPAPVRLCCLYPKQRRKSKKDEAKRKSPAREAYTLTPCPTTLNSPRSTDAPPLTAPAHPHPKTVTIVLYPNRTTGLHEILNLSQMSVVRRLTSALVLTSCRRALAFWDGRFARARSGCLGVNWVLGQGGRVHV